MTTINKGTTIEAPVEKVWAALADFGAISVWNPNVKQSELTSTATEGAGVSRECRLTPMGVVNEVVKEWVEDRRMVVEIVDFKNVPGMRTASAVFELEPRGSGTAVSLDMSYEVGLGPVGSGMNAVMMKRQFNSAATKMLAGLKLFSETGRPVDKRDKLPLASVA